MTSIPGILPPGLSRNTTTYPKIMDLHRTPATRPLKESNELALSVRDMEICRILYGYNQLTPFPLSAGQIVEWKDTILQNVPDLAPAALALAINGMATEQIPFDRDRGIQNVFAALKRVWKKESGEYEILKAVY